MLILVLVACSKPADTDGGTDSDVDTDSGTSSGALTLDNCTTSFGDGVPAFFTTYFRCVDVTVDGDGVAIATSDLPPHPSPYYSATSPNDEEFDTRGGDYHQNPNNLAEKALVVHVPSAPVGRGIVVTEELHDLTMGTSDDEYPGGTAGVGLDGAALFDATARQGDDIREEKWTFDEWAAHPAPDGTYHHHSANPAALAVLAHEGLDGEVYGVMCDGTVLLGCDELDGTAVDAGSLDAQGGHVGDIADADGTVYFTGRYHAHLCTDFVEEGFTPEIQYYGACEVDGGGP
jgi:hypothetical protein